MKTRCNNPRDKHFKDYGGRGISVQFQSFEEFFAEVGPKPQGTSIDRINNDGNYAPGNVRWATDSEQANNTRRVKRLCDEQIKDLIHRRQSGATFKELGELFGICAPHAHKYYHTYKDRLCGS